MDCHEELYLALTFFNWYSFKCSIVKRLQGGPAKVKPTYFTHQNAQTRYYSTVLFYKKTGSYLQKYYKRKG